MERGTVTIVDVRPEKDYEKVGTELRSPATGAVCGAAPCTRCSLASGTCSLRLAEKRQDTLSAGMQGAAWRLLTRLPDRAPCRVTSPTLSMSHSTGPSQAGEHDRGHALEPSSVPAWLCVAPCSAAFTHVHAACRSTVP